MLRIPVSFLLMLAAAAILSGTAFGNPDHVEKDLLFHFAAGTHEIQNGAWQDMTHQATAQVIGAPKFRNFGPTEALAFQGPEYLSLGQNLDDARKLLPVRAMTVTAWVRLDELPERGTIVGFQSKSRNNRDGWALGHNQQSFVFGLAAGEAQAAGSPVTYLVAKTPLEKERWYYLAATYDGQHMRLFVNGELEAESSANRAIFVTRKTAAS